MANQYHPLSEYTKAEIRKLIDACISFDAGNILGPTHKESEVVSYSIPSMNLSWATKEEFNKEVNKLTGTTNIPAAEKVLEKTFATAPEKLESKVLSEAERQAQEAERVKREAALKATTENAKKAVDDAISRQQKLHNSLKGKQIFVHVTSTEKKAKLTTEQEQLIETLRQAAKTNAPGLSEYIEARFKESLPEGTPENEANTYAKRNSLRLIEALRGKNPAESAVTFNAITSSSEVLESFPELKDELPLLQEEGRQQIIEYAVFRNDTRASFGEVFASNVVGENNLDNLNAVLSLTGKANFLPFNLDKVSEKILDSLDLKSKILEGIKIGGYSISNLQNIFYDKVSEWAVSRIASFIPTEVLNTGFVQGALSYFGASTVKWETTSLLGRFLMGTGNGQLFGLLGHITGIDFGITQAASSLATEVIGQGATTAAAVATEGTTAAAIAGGAAAEIGGTAVGATATGTGAVGVGATLGAGGGPVTIILGAIGAWLLSKILRPFFRWLQEKVLDPLLRWFNENKKFLAVFGMLGGLVFGSPLVFGLSGGVLLFSSVNPLVLGRRITYSLASLVRNLFAKVATGIIVFLVTFPIVIALILFIINSSAYVVPPQFGGGGKAGCSPAVADRAKTINDGLLLGFNHYYNHSPDYPELWNPGLFSQNPNPKKQQDSIGAQDMFWCNYMVTKSFDAINESIPFPLSAMMAYFQGQPGKWFDGDTATPNDLCPGDAVFFRIGANTTGLSHVAIVGDVSTDGVSTYESNAPYKSWTYPVDELGHFQVIGSGDNMIKIVGFGEP